VKIVRLFLLSILVATPAVAQATSFQAILSPDAVITGGNMPSSGVSTASGVANFVLNQPVGGPVTLEYSIQMNGIDLNGAQTPGFPNDDITALHFHDTTQCSPATPTCIEGTDTVGTQHVLNVFGFPRLDDDDVMVDPVAGIVSGIWDDMDENLVFPPSNALTGITGDGDAILDLLQNEQLFVNIHTNSFGLGEIGGFIRQVPEPGSLSLVFCGLAILAVRRRR
jgi:hypothetical protein